MAHSTPRRPWRLLILDRDPSDPKWLLATVALPSDVHTARLDETGRYLDWSEITGWVRGNLGQPVGLDPITDALAWHLRTGGSTR